MIRRMQHEDFPDCLKLAEMYTPLDFDNFYDNFILSLDYLNSFVLEDEGIIGIIVWTEGNDQFTGKPYTQVLHWFVDKEHRGRGKELLHFMEDQNKGREIRIQLPHGVLIKGYEPIQTVHRKTQDGN